MRRPLKVVPVPGHGAEDVLVVDGLVYTGTEDGSVFRLRTGDGSAYHMVTGVREHDGRVWLGSLVEPAVASMPIAGA